MENSQADLRANKNEDRLKVVVFEDDNIYQELIKNLLSADEYYLIDNISMFSEKCLTIKSPDLFLVDLKHKGDFKGTKSITFLNKLKSSFPNSEIIVQSGIEDLSIMKDCIENGADGYIVKEYLAEEYNEIKKKLIFKRSIAQELNKLLIGADKKSLELKKKIIKFGYNNKLDVLITGETGVGKDLCARSLSYNQEIVNINASAIPKDLFEGEVFGSAKGSFTGSNKDRKGFIEKAQGGVLFIDEVQSLHLQHQAKLLRFLETRKFTPVGTGEELSFSGRVIFASNMDLLKLVSTGDFREDLYYRISSGVIDIPPLRDRRLDIPCLLNYFLEKYCSLKNKKFTDKALSFLIEEYSWPGNIRELRNLVRSLCLHSKIPVFELSQCKHFLKVSADINIATLVAPKINVSKSLVESLVDYERKILSTFASRFSSSECIKILKISKTSYYEKLKKFNLS